MAHIARDNNKDYDCAGRSLSWGYLPFGALILWKSKKGREKR